MSQIQFIFLETHALPSAPALQEALTKEGFDISVDTNFAQQAYEGTLLCTLFSDKDARFELFYDRAEDIVEELDMDIRELATEDTQAALLEGLEKIKQAAASRDLVLSLNWGASFLDCIAVLMISIALAKYFKACVSYAGQAPVSIQELELGLSECLEAYKNQL